MIIDLLIEKGLTTPLPEDCYNIIPIPHSKLEEIWNEAVKITDKAGPPEDSSYLDGDNPYITANAIGLIGEYHFEQYYAFKHKGAGPGPDKGVDFRVKYTPEEEEYDISINCRNRRKADLPVREWRRTCDYYFLYETNFLNGGDITLVGMVGGATDEMVGNAPLATHMPRRHGQYPHLVKRGRLLELPSPDELEPAEQNPFI